MITVLFLSLLLLAVAIAISDWRRGWLLAILIGVIQDPARKLTPGAPVVMSVSIVIIYVAVIIAAQVTLQQHAREYSRRFSNVFGAFTIVFFFLVLAAVNGLFTFGVEGWMAPAFSLFIYCAPLPAVILGYAYLQREEQIYTLFAFYAIITSVAMIGTPLEYFNFNWPALGTVSLAQGNYRYLMGLEVRMLSGFYRGPDIMGLHAATLSIIGIILSLHARALRQRWIWILVSGWGFLNCLISGRRKALYMIAVFLIAFLWRYVRRLNVTQVAALAVLGILTIFIVAKVSQDSQSSAYTEAAVTSQQEVWGRLEGGLMGTVEQSGIMGAGLGTATQGVYHVVTATGFTQLGWQEGGLGKLAIELGVPGLLSVVILAVVMMSSMMRISKHPDVVGSSQLTRAGLFGLVVANLVEFMASAQAYSDPVLTLLASFFVGCLFASASLDERLTGTLTPQKPATPLALTAPAIT